MTTHCTCAVYRGLACTKCFGLYHNREAITAWAINWRTWNLKKKQQEKAGDSTSAAICRNHAADAFRTIKRLGNFQSDDAVLQFLKTEGYTDE
ncbi:hypothetical protein KMC60_gp15 [Achromobacter phage vB_AxyP_19-32_Axy11]|uniref:Uncharacterized protein n=1 Tax=Achromobacter phage vB_AxyP_19-32_Axy11 TaxID=2591042 RepID=A0A514CU97_9CAUD|nr:hypothetical protein KMC60_gp15 [Achromobacter phage vB_AxyP_19-32_Axy11]QDH84055.1 hypothetical protein Axy11_015 [Achromobacter phage vB_AxyP_19-32_Axy11]